MSGPQFPRCISVPTIGGRQDKVEHEERAVLYYQGAQWKDCRIAAFYPGQKNPDLIFIDIDAKDFPSERALKSALTKTLNNISKKIGGHPTVLWSGRGFHVIQPINCPMDLDTVKEYSDLLPQYDKDVNKAFLQFGAAYLSNDKSDSCNNPSLKSCLLRIPYSINGKNKEEVKVLQTWDNFRPDVELLCGSFYSYLVDQKIKEDQRCDELASKFPLGSSDHDGATLWIETLLQTPIDDHRKLARDLIIIPYLVVRRGMTDVDQITGIVMQWADKCAELRSLEPSRREFEKKTESRVYEVMRDRVPPKRWDTLQQENPELAQKLRVGGND